MPANLQSILDSLQQQKWEARTTVFNVQPQLTGDTLRLTGEVLEVEQLKKAELAVRQAAPHLNIFNDITVLSRFDTGWALSNGALSNLRKSPSNKAEIVAQALYGEPVELLKYDDDGWWFVRLIDSYLGWTVESYLSRCAKSEALAYRADADALVLAGWADAYTMPQASTEFLVGRLPFGVPVKVAERRDRMARVNWEGEPPLWVAERDLLPMSECPHSDTDGIRWTLELMSRFIGVPYLWGGETPFGFDCSGFAQTTMEFMGLRVPRDADLQCFAGRPVEGQPRPGDLLFFGSSPREAPEAERLGAITHVAVSLGGTELIHSTQVLWGVQRNSLDPSSPIYSPWLRDHLAAVRTFV